MDTPASFFIKKRGNIVIKGEVFAESEMLNCVTIPLQTQKVYIDVPMVPETVLSYKWRKEGEVVHMARQVVWGS